MMFARFESETRYYVVLVITDLLGDIVVVRRWGGLGSARGGAKNEPAGSMEEASARFERLGKVRVARGYARVA